MILYSHFKDEKPKVDRLAQGYTVRKGRTGNFNLFVSMIPSFGKVMKLMDKSDYLKPSFLG